LSNGASKRKLQITLAKGNVSIYNAGRIKIKQKPKRSVYQSEGAFVFLFV
jgi:hypothetical protein